KMPSSITHNKAHNKLYMLPFIIGIIGCTYQFLKNKKDWVANFLLFFMTGIAVVIYLNQPGNQPRERDYAYVGSFYAYAVWIGLAMVAFVRMAREKEDQVGFRNLLGYGAGLTFFVTFLSCLPSDSGSSLIVTCLFATALYTLVAAGVTLLARAASSDGKNSRILNIVSGAICMVVPLFMAQQE